jgi:phosphoadenosine phosphosulfate reductase
MRVFFLDTGFHFPETLVFRDEIVAQLGLNVETLYPEMGHRGFRKQHGELYRSDPDLCCFINKVEPMRRAMSDLRAWVTGIRRDQTPLRRSTPILARMPNGVVKVCPMVLWDRLRVQKYIDENGLPKHPLTATGFTSIGCAPCTRPVERGGHERQGRWVGEEKTECGLHIASELEVKDDE